MTTNAFLFSWDCYGIESIIPITQYEKVDKENLLRILREEEPVRNPLGGIIRNLILRAQFNSERHYEIYAIDCDAEFDEEFWVEQWKKYPQFTAELIRDRGHQLYSNRQTRKPVIS